MRTVFVVARFVLYVISLWLSDLFKRLWERIGGYNIWGPDEQ